MKHNLYYTPELLAFLESYSSCYVKGLDRLLERNEEGLNPSVGHQAGAFLSLLASIAHPARILELGTCEGASAIMMSRACPEAEIITIEIRPELAQRARNHFREFGVEERITLLEGDMMEIVPALSEEEPFDMIFLDAAKKMYPRLFQLLLKRLAPGGIWVTDDVFLEMACFPEHIKGIDQALRRFNSLVYAEESLQPVMIPLSHGLLLCRKKEA
ncbi:MAG TPA: O-methyltransferase [Candidatus Mcinerneyibacteriales bacterium]|nr:O-methyltransferase [Candidatus Mcinerneyibacteriales bacterium]